MGKIFVVFLIFLSLISCQKTVDENVKTNKSFKDGKLSVTCEKSSKSGNCNYLIYNKICGKTTIDDEKEEVTCKFTKISEFKLKEKESKTIPDLLGNPEICMKTNVVPTLEDCVKE